MEAKYFERVVLSDVEKILIRQAGITLQYKKKQIIFAPEDLADKVYLIDSGWVKIFRLTADGRGVTVGSIRNPGELMGLAETLSGERRTCFAGALTDVSLVALGKNKFEELLAKHSFLAVKVAQLLGARMREAESIIHEMVSWQAPGRLASTLLKLGEKCGEEGKNGIKIRLPLTHEELAGMVGVSRQTITSLLNTFRNEKSIDYERKIIKIINIEQLSRWIV
ncbi:MAG: Crp/Fnr family transcriptional regulator [Armatimonadetes bacterium]|nr:Crp/Fnr family transcriptional regulator [Armatimonadota bacterium]